MGEDGSGKFKRCNDNRSRCSEGRGRECREPPHAAICRVVWWLRYELRSFLLLGVSLQAGLRRNWPEHMPFESGLQRRLKSSTWRKNAKKSIRTRKHKRSQK